MAALQGSRSVSGARRPVKGRPAGWAVVLAGVLALLAGTLPLLAGPAVRAERAQAAAQGDGDAPAVAVVLARAAAYVDAYQRDFAMMVAQERYQQEARYPGPVMGRGQQDLTTRTVLVSDFLLTKLFIALYG